MHPDPRSPEPFHNGNNAHIERLLSIPKHDVEDSVLEVLMESWERKLLDSQETITAYFWKKETIHHLLIREASKESPDETLLIRLTNLIIRMGKADWMEITLKNA